MVLTNPEYEALAPELVKRPPRTSGRTSSLSPLKRPLRRWLHDSDAARRSPGCEIVAVAEELNADLIVMGQQGRRGLARMMVGDASVRVMGSGHLQRALGAGRGRMWNNRILLGTDGSRFADAAPFLPPRSHTLRGTDHRRFRAGAQPQQTRQEEGRDAVERTTAQLRQE